MNKLYPSEGHTSGLTHRLKREAGKAARFRGHKLCKWEVLQPYRKYWARCLVCNKTVTVNLSPLPNEIDIAGEALALDCHD